MSSLEVNPSPAISAPVEPQPPSEAAPAAAKERSGTPSLTDELRVEGHLHRARIGLVRALLILTGIALLGWLLRGLLSLLGYRHEVTLVHRRPGGLELSGRRRLMGISLGETRELLPSIAIRRVSLVGDSALWAVLAALVVLLGVGAGATVLLLWGIVGRQPSWIALAGALVAAGLLLDGAAYLWVRRSRRQGRATVELDAAGRRYRLTRVGERAAHRLLDQVLLGDRKLG